MRILILIGPEVEQSRNELPTLLAAYYLFRDAGAEIVLASGTGGYPWSRKRLQSDEQTPLMQRFKVDAGLREELANTLPFASVCSDDFDVCLLVGTSSGWAASVKAIR